MSKRVNIRNTEVQIPATDNISVNTVLLLHMNGSDGSQTFVDSTNRHTVTANGNAQIDFAQKVFGNGSALFDTSGDNLSIPDSDDFYLNGDFTLDFRLRLNSTGNKMFYRQSADGSNFFQFYYETANGIVFYSMSGGVGVLNFTAAWSPSINTWYHIALTRSGNTWKVFINGVPLSLSLQVGSYSAAQPNIAADLKIGSDFGSYEIDGWIDELRLVKGVAVWTADFSGSIPSSEYSLMTTGIKKYISNRIFTTSSTGFNDVDLDALNSNLVAAYKFNNGALTTDFKGSNTLTNMNTVTGTASGKSGYGATLVDTNSEYFKIDPAGTDFSFGNKMSFSTWVKFATIDTDDIYTLFIGNSGAHYIGGTVRYLGGNYGVYIYLQSNSTSMSFNFSSEGAAAWTPTAGPWYNIVMTVDLTANQVKYYIDGSLKMTATTTGATLTAMSNLYIGSELGSSRYFNGDMDEVYFWKGVALSQTEVTALYTKFYGIINTSTYKTSLRGGYPDPAPPGPVGAEWDSGMLEYEGQS